MPVKRAAIVTCLSKVSTAIRDGKTDICEDLFQHVHRLAGSAGSYGFETLGQAASVVDRYLISHEPEAIDLPELESMLQVLVNEIDKIAQQSNV
jgi:HPt (histidine-containing phosphotransfer) domain-containing protein